MTGSADQTSIDDLGQGRDAYTKRLWLEAHDSLSRADRTAPLAAEDLELLATSAFMLGREDDYCSSALIMRGRTQARTSARSGARSG